MQSIFSFKISGQTPFFGISNQHSIHVTCQYHLKFVPNTNTTFNRSGTFGWRILKSGPFHVDTLIYPAAETKPYPPGYRMVSPKYIMPNLNLTILHILGIEMEILQSYHSANHLEKDDQTE